MGRTQWLDIPDISECYVLSSESYAGIVLRLVAFLILSTLLADDILGVIREGLRRFRGQVMAGPIVRVSSVGNPHHRWVIAANVKGG